MIHRFYSTNVNGNHKIRKSEAIPVYLHDMAESFVIKLSIII